MAKRKTTLHEAYIASGLSYREIGDALGVSKSMASQVINGHCPCPADKIPALEKALKIKYVPTHWVCAK